VALFEDLDDGGELHGFRARPKNGHDDHTPRGISHTRWRLLRVD
jgi:hypothetical protein